MNVQGTEQREESEISQEVGKERINDIRKTKNRPLEASEEKIRKIGKDNTLHEGGRERENTVGDSQEIMDTTNVSATGKWEHMIQQLEERWEAKWNAKFEAAAESQPPRTREVSAQGTIRTNKEGNQEVEQAEVYYERTLPEGLSVTKPATLGPRRQEGEYT